MKKDARDQVVEKIFETMAKVGTGWTKSWATMGFHRNAQTGREYNGVNALLLSLVGLLCDYEQTLWLTWSQMKAMGGHPKADQWDSSTIVMWVRPDTYMVKDANGNPVLDDNGDPKERKFWKRGLHKVWNVEQTTLKSSTYKKHLPKMRENASDAEIDQWIEQVRAGNGCAEYSVKLTDVACYRPSADHVTVPALGQYKETGEYYSTLFHEMAHSTGHKSRLGRNMDTTKGSSAYAQEELVAELTSALLCAEWGVAGHVRHAKYLNGWMKFVQKDSTVLTVAAAQAKKAVDFMVKAAKKAEEKAA